MTDRRDVRGDQVEEGSVLSTNRRLPSTGTFRLGAAITGVWGGIAILLVLNSHELWFRIVFALVAALALWTVIRKVRGAVELSPSVGRVIMDPWPQSFDPGEVTSVEMRRSGVGSLPVIVLRSGREIRVKPLAGLTEDAAWRSTRVLLEAIENLRTQS
jgi:hypothetical protein